MDLRDPGELWIRTGMECGWRQSISLPVLQGYRVWDGPLEDWPFVGAVIDRQMSMGRLQLFGWWVGRVC